MDEVSRHAREVHVSETARLDNQPTTNLRDNHKEMEATNNDAMGAELFPR